jgi:glycerate kinase
MRYLVAPNAFKGTISARESAVILESEIEKQSGRECLIQPVADGGDGTCELLIESLGLEKIKVQTFNAVGQPTLGYFGWDSVGKKAYMDISTASGIGELATYQKDPNTSCTYGTGLQISEALQLGAEEIVLGLGGSATVDMGVGILQALGFLFLDENGREIAPFSAGFITRIKHIQRPASRLKVKFTILCDVRNPFLGANGAVRVFGPQKGLEESQLETFEKSCFELLQLFVQKSKIQWTDQPGYGAAGGVALGLQFFFETKIEFGAPYFFELVQMNRKVQESDWIITGEGQYDAQSDQGKACFELLKLAKAHRKKIALITSGDTERINGFDAVLKLPSLDFSKPGYQQLAESNLADVIREAFSKGRFS